MLPSTRRTKEETQGLNNIYKENENIYRKEKKLLTYAQHGERTNPPAMYIEGKSCILRLQPHIGDGLDPINHLKDGAFFAIE